MDTAEANISTQQETPSSKFGPTVPVGRFAPSPSGRMHLGNIYAALLAWLSVKSQNGRMLMRIEDLDPRSARSEYAAQLLRDLEWLGLTWDGEVVYQHNRLEYYEAAFDELQQLGLLYPCFCTRAELHAASAPHASDNTPRYPGTCAHLSPAELAARTQLRSPAYRLRVPQAVYSAHDAVQGQIATHLAQCCGDFLVRRSDGVFAYQLVVCVDDAAMGVTDIVRGRDLLDSVPRQLYLQELLDLPHPRYAHVPLLVAPDGRRLAKRDRDLDMAALRERFKTPQALLGWLAYITGMVDVNEPLLATDLLQGFSWDAMCKRRHDIVIDGSLLFA
ncbi:tRNA glutamyl-Q(34) synthetase GluQRS [Collinsella sp. zg1085]|uniref:tRNA glutamyl-Q(34) synthetase GluQRS n=1 Tax=Collinsella sp. zg1085 TaxID=2844380 RepID=UPI001C0B8987|nr:tRNA glutamyl-Q(34) synthetase GluQRS [Collinsella sp. zg1085]QWT18088.1 tRNA glutamyl-Q(34) synthetase GluQRS [Collinsella sp. zg1085]